MADEKTEEKIKATVPQMVRTAKGIADHALAVRETQWDKERRVFKDPFTCWLALFKYAELTATLLDEAEKRLDDRFTKLLTALEQRVAAVEVWKDLMEKQAEAMTKDFEELVSSGKSPIEHIKALLEKDGAPALPSAEDAVKTVAHSAGVKAGLAHKAEQAEDASTVVPIKSEKKREEKKGGGAA
jgi:hypothetical protein